MVGMILAANKTILHGVDWDVMDAGLCCTLILVYLDFVVP